VPKPTQYVYLLQCTNGTIYVGQTQNLDKRLNRHTIGTGARHTAQIRPKELIYTEGPMSYTEAIARERQLKKWSRAKKLALAKGDLDGLRYLSRSRTRNKQ
jgi:putative endonuclease